MFTMHWNTMGQRTGQCPLIRSTFIRTLCLALLFSQPTVAQSALSVRESASRDAASISSMLATLGTLQRGLVTRCAQTPFGWNPTWEVKRSDTVTAQASQKLNAALAALPRSGHVPASLALATLSAWWDALGPDTQLRILCYYRPTTLDQITGILGYAIDDGVALAEIHAYLTQVTDTSVYNDSTFIAGAAEHTPIGRRLHAEAIAMGDPHRYDPQIANLDDLHSNWYGARVSQARLLVMKAEIELAQGNTAAAARTLARAEAWAPLSTAYQRTRLLLQQHDTVGAIRALALCRWTNACIMSPSQDSATHAQLETLYRALHRGSLAGIDTVQTQALARPELSMPVPVTPWRAPAMPTPRDGRAVRRTSVVQTESWIFCPPCAAHTIAANAVKRRYGSSVIVLTYNYMGPMVPPGYALGKSTSVWKRAHAHDAPKNDSLPGPNGLFIDGIPTTNISYGGELGVPLVYDAATRALDTSLTVAPSVQVAIKAKMKGKRITIKVSVTRLRRDRTGHPLKVQIALVEDPVLVVGISKPYEDGVVRWLAGDPVTDFGHPVTLASTVGQTATFTETFDVSRVETATRQWLPNRQVDSETLARRDVRANAFHFDLRHLSIVAFVQDQTTGEILQGAQVAIRHAGH
jgi:hypothetical protein